MQSTNSNLPGRGIAEYSDNKVGSIHQAGLCADDNHGCAQIKSKNHEISLSRDDLTIPFAAVSFMLLVAGILLLLTGFVVLGFLASTSVVASGFYYLSCDNEDDY